MVWKAPVGECWKPNSLSMGFDGISSIFISRANGLSARTTQMPTCVARRRLAPSGITCVSAFYPGRGIPISWPVISTTTRIPPPCAVSCKSMTSLLRKWFLASIPTDIFGPITMPSKIAIPVWIIFWPHPAFSRDWCRKALQSPTDIFPFGHPITG